MPRRLLLLLAALTVLALSSLAGIATAATTGVGAQTRVGAPRAAEPWFTGAIGSESPCLRQGSSRSATRIASGFCVAAEDGGESGISVFRTARAGNGESELENGLNPANHETDVFGGPGHAYVGSEDVAQQFVGRGGYEDFYAEFHMAPEFVEEFDSFLFPYDGGPGFEYEIPADQIDRFNELTTSRTVVQP